MNLINVFILIFFMMAFAIGTSIESDNQILHQGLDNASIILQNISLEGSENPYTNGIYTIVEKFVSFIGTVFIETMRMGISFGSNNPDYFEPMFIFKIIKLLVILIIVFLLIRPVSYLVILIILFLMWLVKRIKERKEEVLRKQTKQFKRRTQ